ncbi:pentapeptide repeat-containing protein [Streptomyces clavifer]|uniref:pentapeptide repeat-containing protein n=1 Tax=Streptomyces clavifer TaxID=68188 RepID=UPI003804DA57
MWLVAPVSLILVGVLAYGLYHGVDAFLTAENPGKKPVSGQDNVKTTVTALTLVGAVLAGLYAYRKQLLEEGASHRADAMQLAERYTKAAEQLGHDQAAVRLAGVYAMARLADDWEEQRRVCVDVLCAYLRMPYETDTGGEGYMKGEREVRLTIIRTIRDHLQDPTTATTWCGHDLDFTGAIFDGGDFGSAAFTGGTVSFRGATFIGGIVGFSRATFTGGTVNFYGATFSGGIVGFSRAMFSGSTVEFGAVTVSGGTVDFNRAKFTDGLASFCHARFTDGIVNFNRARFSGGRVNFSRAVFTGGTANFSRAAFTDGTVEFNDTRFSGGTVLLNFATFPGGAVSFNAAMISDGTVTFHHAMFTGGTVDFRHAELSGGTVDFSYAELSGADIHFSNARIHAACTISWGPLPTLPVNQS